MPKTATPDHGAQAKADLDIIDAAIKALQSLVDQGNPRAVEVQMAALDRRAGALKLAGNGLVRKAADATVDALRSAGRIEPIDTARVVALQVLADAVDADPSNASLWREYRTAEIALREVNDVDSDAFDELQKNLRTSVGDSPIS